MDVFEDLLTNLHASSNDPLKAETIIDRISEYFYDKQSESFIDLLLFLVFNENGVTSFIKKVLLFESQKSNVLNLFTILEFILINFEKYCIIYAEDLKKLFLGIVQTNAVAKLKENALKLLKLLFAPSFIVALDLSNIRENIKNLKEDLPPSVQAQLFSLVGIIFEKLPEILCGGSDFLNEFIQKIEGGSKSNISLVAGCFDGINGYLVNRGGTTEQISRIYIQLKKFSFLKDYGEESRVYTDTRRNALKIIIHHYRIFTSFINTDFEYWLRILKLWLKKKEGDRELGILGLKAVYKAIAVECSDFIPCVVNTKLNGVVKELLEGLEKDFDIPSMIGLVELTSTGHVEEELADKGYHLITKSFLENREKGYSMYLPLNLLCTSNYVTRKNKIKPEHLVQLERMAVAIINNYPKMDSYFKSRSLEALENSICLIDRCGDRELDEYLNEVIYQGLIRSCSHQIWVYAEIEKETTGKEMISHKSFLPLWLFIVDLSNSATGSYHRKHIVASKIFGKYVSSFLKINKKLDVGINIENPYLADHEVTARAVRPNDLRILINNVNLFVDIIEGTNSFHEMKNWLGLVLTDMFDSVYKSPIISEFYKVITVCLKVADKINFFNECKTEANITESFLRDVSLRVCQYKGDLQISCFRLFFAAPVLLIKSLLIDIAPVFKLILEVSSHGQFSLFEECVTTLEKWHKYLPREPVECLIREILPYFNVLLQTGSGEHWICRKWETKWKPLKMREHVRRVKTDVAESQRQLFIQNKFLLFLGSLNQDVSKYLIQDENEDEDEDGNGDGDEEIYSNQILIYDLPFTDGKLGIRVNEFLPRVIELSLSSSDIHTRTRACEFLHSLVIFTLGNMKRMNGELNGLFRKLISLCLVLACDSDHKIFQIYDMLVLQIVHYFGGRTGNLSETKIFINCLMESVSHPYNSLLRNVSARFIRELVKWSEESSDSSGDVSINLEIILENMYSHSVHPDNNKRIGAAIVFNNIYDLIKDEKNFLDTHWFMLYYYFIECLGMCSVYDDTAQIVHAIQLIKSSLSNKELHKQPKVPSGFENCDITNLMTWIFRHCSNPEAKIRKLSMSMIENFSRGSVKDFIRVYVADVHVKSEYLKSNSDEEHYSRWLSYISALFHYYGWLVKHDAVNYEDLKRAGIEKQIQIFLDEIIFDSKSMDSTSSGKSFSILQMFEFLTECAKRQIVLHNSKLAPVIKTCLFKPSQYKFEAWDMEMSERLDSVLKEIISRRLDFHIESLDVDMSCLSHPRLLRFMVHGEPLDGITDLINGLKTLHTLKALDLVQKVSGDEIFQLVFNSISFEKDERCYGFTIKPNDKVLLSELLKFGTDIGVSPRKVLDLLKDKEVIEGETLKRTTKGSYFMETFKQELLNYFIHNFDTAFDDVLLNLPEITLETIADILNRVVESDCLNKEKIIFKLRQRWSDIEKLSVGNNVITLIIITNMSKIFPNLLIEDDSVRNWFFNFAANSKAIEETEMVFNLIPFISNVNEESNEGLSILLKNIELNSSGPDNLDSKMLIAYKGLLNGFAQTQSLPLLQEIIGILMKYKNFMKEDEMVKVFVAIGKKEPSECLGKILSFLYTELFKCDETSIQIYEFFFITLLKKCSAGFGWAFFFENLDQLLHVMNGDKITGKMSALKIIQVFILNAKREELDNLPQEKREAFRKIITICSKLRSNEESEIDRMYSCSCFNTLCTVISVRSKDPKLYKSLIFKEDFPFLPHLINQKKKWNLSMDFDEIPKRKKIMTALRKSITKDRQIELGKSISAVKYLQGDTLFDSSLKEDVTKFDFFFSLVRPLGSVQHVEENEQQLELEMDQLNNHECMPTLVGIIKYMVDEGITPPDVEIRPFWLSSIMNRLSSLRSSENEKIFLLKLIYNLDEYIKPFAIYVVPILLDVIVEVFQEKPINYLLTDLITIIFSWNLNWRMIGKRLKTTLTKLILFIVKKSDSFRNDIIKSNLEVAKLILEACKDNIDIETLSKHAFEGLRMGKTYPKDIKYVLNYINFQFCGILLANSIPAWVEGKESEFIELLLEYFGNDKTGKLAAEIGGLSLKLLRNNNYGDCNKIVEMICRRIRDCMSSKPTNDLSLLYAVYKGFPEITSNFVALIRNSAWTLGGQFKIQSLEMLLTYVKTPDCWETDTLVSTIHIFLSDMLSSEDFEALSLSLEMIDLILDKGVNSTMDKLIEKALSFGNFDSSRVRKCVYKIASHILEKWDKEFSKNLNARVSQLCKLVLLNGMNDGDVDLSEMSADFWYRMMDGLSTVERFSRTLCELYSPEMANGLLNLTGKLMIRSAVNSSDYGKNIFEHPLVSNSGYERRIISAGTYHSTITPTFSISLSSFLSQSCFGSVPGQAPGRKEEEKRKMKRFSKNPQKSHVYFSKKKASLKDKGERKKLETQVDLVREYKDGDFPFIQITHYDLLKPLEELVMKDPQIARNFITALYDGFAENSPDDKVKEMYSKMNGLIRQVLEESTYSDPAVVAFLFHVLLQCGGRLEADSERVSKIAKSTGWSSIGGLLIEEMIIRSEGETTKGKVKDFTSEEKKWINLAEISRSLNEFEVLRGIFVDKLKVGANAYEAIRSESISDWFKAARFYESVLEQGTSLYNDFYVNAYLNSLARLSDWTKVNTYICENYDLNDLWSDSSLFEKVLPWLIKTDTMELGNSNGLISKFQTDPEKKSHLKHFFVQDLAISNYFIGNLQWAKYYLHQMCMDFLSAWSHWNKWSNNLRLTKLMQLQLMSELDKCVNVLFEKSNQGENENDLMYLWSRNFPEESDDLMDWDMKFALRNHLLSQLRMSYPNLNLSKINRSDINSNFEMVRCGIAQRNVRLCEKYLRSIKGKLKTFDDHELLFMYSYYCNSLEFLRTETSDIDESVRVRKIVDAAAQMQKRMSDAMDDGGENLLFFECNMTLSRAMHLLQSYEDVSYVTAVLNLTGGNAKEILREKELEYLENARRVAESSEEKLVSKAYIQIVNFYRRDGKYRKDLAKFLFRSMNLGSIEARQLFCFLLNAEELARDWVLDPELKELSGKVPVWMFLKWSNQILANLDSEMFPFLKCLVLPLAEEYPNSIRFPFELSKSNYQYDHSFGSECRQFTNEIADKILSDINYRNFATALSFLAQPERIFKYELNKIINEINRAQPKWDLIAELVEDLYKRMHSQEYRQFRGSAFDCLTKFESELGSLNSFENIMWKEKLESMMEDLPKVQMDRKCLKQFCPWLAGFQGTKSNASIEIPGQYYGEHKPLLKHHVTISSFKQSVLSINSKCKPVRITILGNDAREYKFLIKFGKDLRLDQRIQQVFAQVNYVLKSNRETYNFSIDTYRMIPVKINLGIIEWVNNTASLSEMLTKSNAKVKDTIEKVQQDHLEFLAQDKEITSVKQAQINGFLRLSRDNAVSRFLERVYAFDWDLLRRAFWKLSSYPEHFVYLRKNFAISEAVIFISHWLVGIGDRHLENTLVSSKTGRALGIDFGCSFGFATKFLTPPEMVPFRLTPQIVNLLKPLGVSGFIKEIMIHCLRAFRNEESLLLATFEVVASEPALSWLEKARQYEKFTEGSEWCPRKEVLMVKEKLACVNPVKIISDDLKAGHSNSPCLNKYLEVLDGDGKRSRSCNLTEEEEIEFLIDLASDYHILSKTCVGWNPWL